MDHNDLRSDQRRRQLHKKPLVVNPGVEAPEQIDPTDYKVYFQPTISVVVSLQQVDFKLFDRLDFRAREVEPCEIERSVVEKYRKKVEQANSRQTFKQLLGQSIQRVPPAHIQLVILDICMSSHKMKTALYEERE